MSAMSVRLRAAASFLLLGALVACERRAPAPVREEPPRPPAPYAERVAALRSAAEATPTALEVRPLPDPGVEDRLLEAERLEARGLLREAAALLEQARERDPASPKVLQRLAENAFLRGDLEGAERLAREAQGRGPGVGSLCARHWLLIAEVETLRGREEEALSAREQAARCAVERPPRF